MTLTHRRRIDESRWRRREMRQKFAQSESHATALVAGSTAAIARSYALLERTERLPGMPDPPVRGRRS